jgi:hypothetical protein|tara:strand:+ start:26 stop:175 length:150 start_codon:yes stop_codon:yes gene_type:complete
MIKQSEFCKQSSYDVLLHQGINCRPYELDIIELELGDNRWLDLIKMSKV